MDRSSELEFRTAPAPASASATSASCSNPLEYFSARRESTGMGESGVRGGRPRSIDEQIELSKSHWSQLADSVCSSTDEDVAADNMAAFEELQRHPSWGLFFKTFGYDTEVRYSSGTMEVGEKFAEGGQAELFHVHITWADPEDNEHGLKEGTEWVMKVFKKGTLLRELQKQWPHGYLHWWTQELERQELGKPLGYRYSCAVLHGTLLRDGRFAFVMVREQQDLRSLIDSHVLEHGYGHGPFQEEDAEWYMYCIALGMDWLHNHNIVHRDLKASNVLVREYQVGIYGCYVADFECSVGVVGTGFWRAPEILKALKEKNISQRPEVFSEMADIYSYGMTCYEVLTGKKPFENHPLEDNSLLMDLVIKQELRPEVRDFVNVWTRDLLRSCWESNPKARPSFGEILRLFEANSNSENIKEWMMKRSRRTRRSRRTWNHCLKVIKRLVCQFSEL